MPIDFFSLPVYQNKNEILDELRKNQVIVIESPTGSGKTTQLPLILREDGYDKRGIIGITQPRRIATLSVTEFIKKQIGDNGSYAAYKMRFADTSTAETRIKVMTDGILLQEVKADPLLSKYSVIMVDEAHERSLNIDFILGLLKEIIAKRSDLKIVVSSATINTKTFSDFFFGAPIISIDAKTYPIAVNYMPLRLMKDREDEYYGKIDELIFRDKKNNPGDVLVFLPGEAEIKGLVETLARGKHSSLYQLYPLYGRLSKEDQEKVFTPTKEGKVKVVVATNIAEASITIDGITTVIDSGLAKVNYYNQRDFTSSLVEQSVSRSSANQRKGRAGRTRAGVCYRLYSEEDFKSRPEFSEEEILHSDLAEVALRMSELGIYNYETFPFITVPKANGLKSAEETLRIINAINEDHTLTSIGEMMIKFPLLPRLSRVIVESIMNYPSVMDEVLVAVSTLSTRQAYIMPIGEEYEARNAHKAFQNPKYGDFIGMRTMFDAYKSLKSREEREAFAKAYYLDIQTLDEIQNIHRQLSEQISEEGIYIGHGGSIDEYFCCLIAGLRQYVARKEDNYSYRTITADRIYIHPGSSWFRILPEYILAGEIVRTSKMYARTVSPVLKRWLDSVDPTLIDGFRGTRKAEKKAERKAERREKDKTKERKNADAYLDGLKTVNVGKKTYYVLSAEDLYDVNYKNKGLKYYLETGGRLSRVPIKTTRLKYAHLLKWGKVLKGADILPAVNYLEDGDGLIRLLDSLFSPVEGAKNTFDVLGLKLSGDKAALVPFQNIEDAMEETLSSLYEITERLPKRKKSLFKKIYPYMEKIEDYL